MKYSQEKYDLYTLLSGNIKNAMPLILTNYPFEVEMINSYMDKMEYFFMPEPYLTRNENLDWEAILNTGSEGFIHSDEINNNIKASKEIDIFLKKNNYEKDKYFNELFKLNKNLSSDNASFNVFSPWKNWANSNLLNMEEVPGTIESHEILFFWFDKLEKSFWNGETEHSTIDQYCTLYNRCSFEFDLKFFKKLFAQFKTYDSKGQYHSNEGVFNSLALITRCWTDLLSGIIDNEMVSHLLYGYYLHRSIAIEEINDQAQAESDNWRENELREYDNFEFKSKHNNPEWDDETINNAFDDNPDNSWNVD